MSAPARKSIACSARSPTAAWRSLVVSSDLPEVLALADRIIVMAEGSTVGELAGDMATEEQVLRLATRYTASVAEARREAAAAEV